MIIHLTPIRDAMLSGNDAVVVLAGNERYARLYGLLNVRCMNCCDRSSVGVNSNLLYFAIDMYPTSLCSMLHSAWANSISLYLTSLRYRISCRRWTKKATSAMMW